MKFQETQSKVSEQFAFQWLYNCFITETLNWYLDGLKNKISALQNRSKKELQTFSFVHGV